MTYDDQGPQRLEKLSDWELFQLRGSTYAIFAIFYATSIALAGNTALLPHYIFLVASLAKCAQANLFVPFLVL